MTEDENESENRQKKKEDLFVLKKDEFIGKSNYEIYMRCRSKDITDPETEYYNLIQLIKTGKEELPDDPKKEDELEIKKLYDEACLVEKTQITKPITVKYDWSDPASKSHRSLQLSADDGGYHTSPPELFDGSRKSFKENQYSKYLPALRGIDSRIYHFLIKYKVISKLPSSEDIEERQDSEDALQDDEE